MSKVSIYIDVLESVSSDVVSWGFVISRGHQIEKAQGFRTKTSLRAEAIYTCIKALRRVVATTENITTVEIHQTNLYLHSFMTTGLGLIRESTATLGSLASGMRTLYDLCMINPKIAYVNWVLCTDERDSDLTELAATLARESRLKGILKYGANKKQTVSDLNKVNQV